jgi:hypothetical protein
VATSGIRLALLLTWIPGCPLDGRGERLDVACKGAVGADEHIALRWGIAVKKMPPTRHREVVAGSFDAYVQIDTIGRTSTSGLESAAYAIRDRLGGLVDPTASTLGIGNHYQVHPGHPDIEFVYALRRQPDFDHQTFADYWLHVHGAAALRYALPPEGYAQHHFDPVATAEWAAAVGLDGAPFDGVALAGFRSARSFQEFLGSAAVGDAALAAEREFINHATSACALVRVASD